MALKSFTLKDFLNESNRIEGMGPATPKLIAAAEAFLDQSTLKIDDFVAFVGVAQPNARLRTEPHLNVRVGNHIAPRGGDQIVEDLTWLCVRANRRIPNDVYPVHVQYETLHPFTDGNGRSGRILWLWMMGGIERAPLGFLHHWYYQSLQNSRGQS